MYIGLQDDRCIYQIRRIPLQTDVKLIGSLAPPYEVTFEWTAGTDGGNPIVRDTTTYPL